MALTQTFGEHRPTRLSRPVHKDQFAVGILCIAILVTGASCRAQADVDQDLIMPDVHHLTDSTGSLVILSGSDGPVIVGTLSPGLVARARLVLEEIGTVRPRYVILISSDSAVYRGSGEWEERPIVTVAHEFLRMEIRSLMRNVEIPGGMPTVGFSEVLQLTANGDDIHLVHQPSGYSHADVSVHFEERRFLYLGNLFVSDGYPWIDIGRGGSVDGLIAAADNFLSRFGGHPEYVEPIIPGRGPVATLEDLRAYRAMLVAIREPILAMARAGQSLEEVLAARPTSEFDERWGNGPVSADEFAAVVYESLVDARDLGGLQD